jgi:hypothetical protein
MATLDEVLSLIRSMPPASASSAIGKVFPFLPIEDRQCAQLRAALSEAAMAGRTRHDVRHAVGILSCVLTEQAGGRRPWGMTVTRPDAVRILTALCDGACAREATALREGVGRLAREGRDPDHAPAWLLAAKEDLEAGLVDELRRLATEPGAANGFLGRALKDEEPPGDGVLPLLHDLLAFPEVRVGVRAGGSALTPAPHLAPAVAAAIRSDDFSALEEEAAGDGDAAELALACLDDGLAFGMSEALSETAAVASERGGWNEWSKEAAASAEKALALAGRCRSILGDRAETAASVAKSSSAMHKGLSDTLCSKIAVGSRDEKLPWLTKALADWESLVSPWAGYGTAAKAKELSFTVARRILGEIPRTGIRNGYDTLSHLNNVVRGFETDISEAFDPLDRNFLRVITWRIGGEEEVGEEEKAWILAVIERAGQAAVEQRRTGDHALLDLVRTAKEVGLL